MSKPLLLIVTPFKFKEFDWYRFELSSLEKEYNVEIKVHQLIDFIMPQMKKSLQKTLKKENIISFKSFSQWKKDFKNILKEKKSSILAISHISNTSLSGLLVNFELKKSKINVLDYTASAHHPITEGNYNYSNIIFKLFIFLRNLKTLKFFITSHFFTFIGNFFNLVPTYALRSGTKGFKDYYYKKKTKIVNGHSFDYSMYITSKKENLISSDQNYALYLDSPSPLYANDDLISGIKMSEYFTPENWYPSLGNFFDNLENQFKIKIKIAPHPKSKHLKFDGYYNGREILNEDTVKASAGAKMIISRESSALSFATIYKKPIILIYSKELNLNKIYMSQIQFYAMELGVKLVNIDDKFDHKIIIDLMKFDKKKYDEYINKYLTSRKDEKENYKIIGDLLTLNEY